MEGRPSAWYAGLGLGMAAVGVLLVPVAIGEWPVSWLPVPFIVGLACLGAVPFWEWATWPKADAEPYEPDEPESTPVAPVPVIRRITVNDRSGTREIDLPDTRPARWAAWQGCVEAALDWARIRGGITSGVMVGPSAMFRDRGDWVTVTGAMAAAGLLEKANGRVTRLTGNVDALLARVHEGRCEWPTDADPPAYSPAPVSLRAETVLAN